MNIPEDKPDHGRWSVEQRLAFGRNRLFWDGSLQREDIMRRFGVSSTQATTDLSRLRAAMGESMAYDVSRRAYVPHADFAEPAADASALLTELRLIAEGMLPEGGGILSTSPPLAVAGLLVRAVDSQVLRAILWAIRDHAALTADYVSFQRPDVTRRTLSPHALVFDGFRWHARAHDAEDGRFKDFVLARLSQPAILGAARAVPERDEAWKRMVALTIAPHPGLSTHQRAVVERDYGMCRGVLVLTVREAVAFYARKRLGLLDGHETRPPREQQIVLLS